MRRLRCLLGTNVDIAPMAIQIGAATNCDFMVGVGVGKLGPQAASEHVDALWFEEDFAAGTPEA